METRKTKHPKSMTAEDCPKFEKLCGYFCTEREIMQAFQVSRKTLESFCRKYYKMSIEEAIDQYKTSGRIQLRINQLEIAKANAKMAIFLGKNELGQKDETETKFEPIKIINSIPKDEEN